MSTPDPVAAALCADPDEVLGVNDRVQLAHCAAVMRDRINESWMREGVTIADPSSTWLDVDVELALGNPPTEILRTAEVHGCDLIAMTSHGHKLIGDIFLLADALGVERLLGQWVHRHGHPSLALVLVELQAMDPEGMAWWQGGVDRALDPGVEPVVEPVSQQLPPPPAPQANPDLARLRSWLPDRVERRRAA